MVKIHKNLFALFICLSFSIVESKSSVSLDLSGVHFLKDKNNNVKPTVFLDETFQLKAITFGNTKGFQEVKMSGLRNFFINSKAHSESISVHNSTITSEKTIDYTLQPKQLGVFKIGPAKIKQNGNTYKSNIVTVYVEKPTAKKQENLISTSKKKSYDLFCKLLAEKKESFIEEPIKISFLIYHRGNISRIEGISDPNFENCTIKELKGIEKGRELVDNKTYNVIKKEYLVFPNKASKIVIPPAQVIYRVKKKSKRRLSFGHNLFAGFFGDTTKQKIASSNALEITVHPIPDCKERCDGIGQFDYFLAKIDKTTVVANEPMKFSLELSGNANFDLIPPPALRLPSGFKSYDSKTTQSKQKISFEFILQIPERGEWSMPKQVFTYFDTKQKVFKTLKTEPIKISVSNPDPTSIAKPTKNVSEEEEKEVSIDLKEIHFIQEEGLISAGSQAYKFSFLFFIILLLIFPFSLFLSPKILKRFKTDKTDIEFYKKEIADLIESNQIEKIYSLFLKFFSDLYKIPINLISEDRIAEKLRSNRRLEEAKTESLLKFLNECAQYSFASQEITNLHELQKKAEYWLVIIFQAQKK